MSSGRMFGDGPAPQVMLGSRWRAQQEAQWQAQHEHEAREQRSQHRRALLKSRAGVVLKFAGLIGAVLALGAALVFGWRSGWLAAQLQPRQVVVRGAEMCQAPEVLQLLGCDSGSNLLSLWWHAGTVSADGNRWLVKLSMHPTLGRSAVIDVTERRPLVALDCGRCPGWLCDDGQVVPQDPAHDKDARFTRLAALPRLILPEGSLDQDASNPGQLAQQPLADADKLLAIVAACARDLPLQVRSLELADDNTARLTLSDGFSVHLGELTHLDVKLAALPKALRLCEEVRPKLQYLDASDSGIFYEKWKVAPKTNAE